MKLKLTPTQKYRFNLESIKENIVKNIKIFDVIHCTEILNNSKNNKPISSKQIYVHYECYNVPFPENKEIQYYIKVLDQETIEFIGNFKGDDGAYFYHYEIECFCTCGELYNVTIEDTKYNIKTQVPYLDLTRDKFTTQVMNPKNIISELDPAIYSYNEDWNDNKIGFQWIKPQSYKFVKNNLLIDNNIINQRNNWVYNVNQNFAPTTYTWYKTKIEPTINTCMSVSQYRDKYFRYDIDIWKYDETASQNFEYFASSGNDNIFIDNKDNLGNEINIVSQNYDLVHYGFKDGDIICDIEKTIDNNGNYILGNNIKGVLYLSNVDAEMALISSKSINPVYPQTSMIQNFIISNKSKYNNYRGKLYLSKYIDPEFNKVYLVLDYDNNTTQKINIESSKITNTNYRYNFSNMGLIFTFESPDTNFVNDPTLIVYDSTGKEITSGFVLNSLNKEEVKNEQDHKKSKTEDGELYEYRYRTYYSYNAYDDNNLVSIQNYNSDLSESQEGTITLIGSTILADDIIQGGIPVQNVKISGYTFNEQITIINAGNNKFNISGSSSGKLGEVIIGSNTVKINSATLTLEILQGSKIGDMVKFLISDYANFKITKLSIDINLSINRNVKINKWGTASIYNNKMVLNSAIPLHFVKDNTRFQLMDIITQERLVSGSFGKSLELPGGSILTINKLEDSYYDFTFTNLLVDDYQKNEFLIDEIIKYFDVKVANISKGVLIKEFDNYILSGINDINSTAWGGVRLPTESDLSLDDAAPYNHWQKVTNINGKIKVKNDLMIDNNIVKENYTKWTIIPDYINRAKFMKLMGADFDEFCKNNFTISNIYSYCLHDTTLIKVYINNKKVDFEISDTNYIKINQSILNDLLNDVIVIIEKPYVSSIGLREYQTIPKYKMKKEVKNGVVNDYYYFWSKSQPIVIPSTYFFISSVVKSVIIVDSDYNLYEHNINDNGSLVIYTYFNTIARELDSYATKIVTSGCPTGKNKILNLNVNSNININQKNKMQYDEWIVIDNENNNDEIPLLILDKIINTINKKDYNNKELPYNKYINLDYKNNTNFRYGIDDGKILMESSELKNLLANIIVDAKLDMKYNDISINNKQNIILLLNNECQDFLYWFNNNAPKILLINILQNIIKNMIDLGYNTQNFAMKSSYINLISNKNKNIIS